MEVKAGDWVRTEAGLEGSVHSVAGGSAYVALESTGLGAHLTRYELSKLTKIEKPAKPEK